MPKEIKAPTIQFVTTTTNDFLKHKRIVGEVEVRDSLMLLFLGGIMGFCLGVMIGIFTVKL